jgi:cytochrome c556
MKRTLITVALITLFAASFVFAADHEAMHKLMTKQGGPKTDDRRELTMHDPMKVMHKSMMRQHLNTVSEIVAALALNNLTDAADIARTNMGWSKERGEECSVFEPDKNESDFTKLSTAMHKQADKFADAAEAGNRDEALTALSELINRCNDCHNVFRH